MELIGCNPPGVPRCAGSRSGMRILIADDDLTSRKILTGVLEKQGHQVEITLDGIQAWEALQAVDAPQIAIIDWMMPGMDGPEVVRRVRAADSEAQPYILLLTKRSQTSDIITGLDAGADDYLTKPFNPGELRARISVGARIIGMQTALIESRKALAHQAAHDSLTGLMNRETALSKLYQELSRAERTGDRLAIGMCDVDHFKQVNDTYGHQTGDDVLRMFSSLLNDCLRPYDTAARMGGEEFLVIAPIQPGRDFAALFERIRERVEFTPLPTRSGPLSITISIGVACSGEGTDCDRLLAASDAALYRAKDAGRNCVAYESGLRSSQITKSRAELRSMRRVACSSIRDVL